jgi:sirohydrochlorin ferrochelatase
MRALLIVAHGSRRAASNDEIRTLTQKLAVLAKPDFAFVNCAFLEIAEPLIPEGLLEAMQAGADEVVLLPYFLSAGRHVAEDIPKIVSEFTVEHPQLKVTIAPYLGLAPGLLETLLQLAKK